MKRKTSQFEWHDAVVRGYALKIGDAPDSSMFELKIDAYPSEESSKRVPVTIEARGLRRLSNTLDLLELADNAGAGNVSNGYISLSKRKKNDAGATVLRVYFVEGYLEIAALSIQFRFPQRSHIKGTSKGSGSN
jgi:hypothetical protein